MELVYVGFFSEVLTVRSQFLALDLLNFYYFCSYFLCSVLHVC